MGGAKVGLYTDVLKGESPEGLRMWQELAVTVALFAAGLVFLGKLRAIIIILIAVWFWLTADKTKFGAQRLGLVWRNSKSTLWMLEYALFLALAVWVVGLVWGPARHVRYSSDNLLFGKLGYLLAAAVQQFSMQSYCFVRLEKLLGCPMRSNKSVSWLFCLLHFPNPVLMLVAYWGGRLSCRIFWQYRNLYVLMLSHALVGAAMASFWPSWVMRAGSTFGRMLFAYLFGR